MSQPTSAAQESMDFVETRRTLPPVPANQKTSSSSQNSANNQPKKPRPNSNIAPIHSSTASPTSQLTTTMANLLVSPTSIEKKSSPTTSSKTPEAPTLETTVEEVVNLIDILKNLSVPPSTVKEIIKNTSQAQLNAIKPALQKLKEEDLKAKACLAYDKKKKEDDRESRTTSSNPTKKRKRQSTKERYDDLRNRIKTQIVESLNDTAETTVDFSAFETVYEKNKLLRKDGENITEQEVTTFADMFKKLDRGNSLFKNMCCYLDGEFHFFCCLKFTPNDDVLNIHGYTKKFGLKRTTIDRRIRYYYLIKMFPMLLLTDIGHTTLLKHQYQLESESGEMRDEMAATSNEIIIKWPENKKEITFEEIKHDENLPELDDEVSENLHDNCDDCDD